ncbi:MAG: hypothetical protein ACTSQY_00070 [Candidatus Odinarchaeia archaeon]|nr:MAG: hypothetical protein [Lokiarchaeota virus Fenrir Meg22_1012]URC17193.1 MAG: hypothetical protein [Lokiarchaeota virus Fenrir Meg22_1214]
MSGNLGDYMLVPDYLRRRYLELVDLYDKEWEPYFSKLMPKVIGEGKGSLKYWTVGRMADPQAMAKFYAPDEAIEPMNFPSIRPWSFQTRLTGNAFFRRRNMFAEDFEDGVIDKAHAEMLEALTKMIDRTVEYTLCQFAFGNTTVMGRFTNQDTNRQGVVELAQGKFNSAAASELGGVAWSDFSSGTPPVFKDFAYLKERYKYLANSNPVYMSIGRKTEYSLEINDNLLNRLIRLKDTTNGVLGDYLMGLKLLKITAQTYKEIPNTDELMEGMPGKGDYLELDWSRINRKDMMTHDVGGKTYEWSVIGDDNVGEIKCSYIDEYHKDERGSPTQIFIEQWEERNPRSVWTTAQLEFCPHVKDYAKIMLIKEVAEQ